MASRLGSRSRPSLCHTGNAKPQDEIDGTFRRAFWARLINRPNRKTRRQTMSFISELQRRNVVRVAVGYLAGAWLLIQILETLFPIFGLSETSIRVVVVILAIGFPIVLVLSWIFEWTPEGLQRDDGVVTETDAIARRRLDRVIFVLLVLAVAYFSVDKFVLDPARDAELAQAARDEGRTAAFVESYGDKSIAVLPFVDLSEGGDQAYFSDGIAEEILNLLAKVDELRVISRSSAFQYRGDDVHIPTVADELNVSYVLEGSVRKAGDQLRITAQLIDARADTHLWSETYDREFSDIFAIQDEISDSIVNQLQISLLGARPTVERTDPETYALYLQALERDPDYVPALNLKAQLVYMLTGDSPDDKYPSEEGIPMMREYHDRVLAIDPNNSEATFGRGWLAYLRNDLETAALYINRALEYDPSDVFTLFGSGVINGLMGRHEEAVKFQEAALARDPLCNRCLYQLMRQSFLAGDLDKAQAAAERRMRVAPGGWFTLGHIHLFKGDIQKAMECYDNQKDNRLDWLASTAIAHFELGDQEASDAALSELKKIDDTRANLEIAKVHAWRNEADSAFQWLDRSYDQAGSEFLVSLSYNFFDPFFRNLNDDPRWLALRERAGLDPERLAAIRIDLPKSTAVDG
jgi:adenylate cyclase